MAVGALKPLEIIASAGVILDSWGRVSRVHCCDTTSFEGEFGRRILPGVGWVGIPAPSLSCDGSMSSRIGLQKVEFNACPGGSVPSASKKV